MPEKIIVEIVMIKKMQFLIEQGHFMIEDGSITSLMAGGKRMPVRTIEVEI